MTSDRQGKVDQTLHQIRLARWRARRDSDPLTRKQQRFVEEYLIDLNATQAALRAGYSSWSAKQIGYELLRYYPNVRSAVEKAVQERRRMSVDRLNAILHPTTSR